MSTCTILDLGNEPSKLYDQLVEVFGNKEEALIEYRKVIGNKFAEKFGDWKFNYQNPGSSQERVGLMDGAEPKLGYDPINNLHYFTDKNNERIFVNKLKFSEFEDSEVKDVVGFLFNRFAVEYQQSSLSEFKGTPEESSRVLKSINDSIKFFKEELLTREDLTSEERVELLEKINKVEKNKNAFKSELIIAISDLGVKVRERVEDVAEEDKGGGVNIRDSFETSTKQSATTRTKILLSTIERKEIVENEDGEIFIDNIKDGYLKSQSYETLDNVWNTLNKLLVDTTGYGDGNGVTDIYKIMYSKLEDMQQEFPFIDDILHKLDHAESTGDIETLNGFVQAFNKTGLNYFVTQTNKGAYSVINATETNSRKNQITNTWTNNFAGSFLTEGRLAVEQEAELKAIRSDLQSLEKEFKNVMRLAGTDIGSDGYMETMGEFGLPIQNAFIEKLHQLGATTITSEHVEMLMKLNGVNDQASTMLTMMSQSVYALDSMFRAVDKGTRELNDDGATYNMFKKERLLLGLADAQGFSEVNINETSVLLNQGKTGYAISNPTYISNTVNMWKAESEQNLDYFRETGEEMDTALINMGKNPDLQNSQWLNYLLARGENLSDKDRVEASTERIGKLTVGLDSSFTSQGKNDGVSNTEITTNDHINANIAQLLNQFTGINQDSMFPTIVAADKSRRILFKGFEAKKFGFARKADGTMLISNNAVKVASGYFKDEYSRMRRVNRENETLPADKQIVHYHGKDGNGTKSQIFPELSRENTDPAFQEFRDAFYNVETFNDPHFKGLSDRQQMLLEEAMAASLEARVTEHAADLQNINGINSKLGKEYNLEGDLTTLAGDYFMNGLMSSVEYTKLFSGDPAYYKNTADLIKRIPATYTDGLQLRLDSKDSVIFNQATVNGVEVASRYVQKIKDSLNDKSIAKAYDRVNTTDAQAWITPRRWKFLKDKLGQWTKQHDVVFAKMQSGETLTASEAKLAAQPLKGVYFEINEGRPVYLKYSQAVLIPSLVKGTPMEALYNKMTQDADGNPIPDSEAQNEIHEVITIDGVKVGAVAPTSLHKDGTTEMLSDIELNPVRLSNRGWKLQQDLPIKRMHDTNVGSQIQKNIFEGLDISDQKNYTVDGTPISGADLAQRMHNTVSDLSDLGKKAIKEKFGIDENNTMTNTDLIYDALIQEFQDRGGNDNVIVALQKRMPFDAIPQIKGKVESILMSMMSREIIKISTEGGSFIQVSPFGLETVGFQAFEKTEEYKKLEQIRKDFNKDFSSALDNHSEELEIGDELFDRLIPEGIWNDGIIDPNTGKGTPIDTQKVFGKSQEEMTQEVRSKFISWFKENAKREASVKEIILNGKKVDISNPTTPEQIMGAIVKGFFDKTTPAIKEYVSKKDGLGRAMLRNLNNKGKGRFKYSDEMDDNASGIIPLSQSFKDEGALLPPRIDKNTGEVLPGQAMIPHSQAVQILAKNGIDLAGKTMEEAMALLDPSALEMITYRIPNQGMSSNDYLEIVGVLPDGMGDSIIVYDGLPAKTGSDFDIDKLFAMQNHVVFNKEAGKVEKLTEDNRHLAIKTPSRKGKEAVMYTEAEIDKMLLQNKLVAEYKAVLNSPSTYDNMMRSIDGAQLKDDIVGTKDANGELKGGLFPAKKFKNMELFSPLTQLRTKSDYISGKFGVGQTANMLVDHSVNQMMNVRMHTWLGVGNQREETVNGKKKLITFFDTETQDSHSIADNLSAFLNAYVDIAKDPYIGRANHNAITANTTFMLLRAGAPLNWVNRFIGQPIIRELVEAQYEQQSITAEAIKIEGQNASALDKVMLDAGIVMTGKATGVDVSRLDAAEMEAYIRAVEADPQARSPEYDTEILLAWQFLSEKGKMFGDSVVAAKSDTAGPGASNVERLINYNKIEKVLDEGVILGYAEKFGTADNRTMLGTYKENSVDWVGQVISNSDLFLSGKEEMEAVFNSVSEQTGNGPLLTNLDLGKSIEANLYSFMMSGTDLFKGIRNEWKDVTVNTVQEVFDRQTEETDNAFLQALGIESANDGTQYLSLDSKNKATGWQNDMYRAWSKLYNTYNYVDGVLDTKTTHPDRKLAIKLAKYSFMNSGFQNNLAQFFTSLPHQIVSDYNTSSQVKEMMTNVGDIHHSSFVDQYQRHSYENSDVVKGIKLDNMTHGTDKDKNSVGFVYKVPKYGKGLGTVRRVGKKEVTVYPKFVSARWKGKTELYEQIGTVTKIDETSQKKDGTYPKIKLPVYSKTFKMGKKVGKLRQFEYIRGENPTESVISENKLSPKELENQRDYLAYMAKEDSTFVPSNGVPITSEKLAKIGESVIEDTKVVLDNLDVITEELNIKCK